MPALVRTPGPEIAPPVQTWSAEEPVTRFDPAFGRVMVPASAAVRTIVWIVSTPPMLSVAPVATVVADVSAIRSSPEVASVPAEIVDAPVKVLAPARVTVPVVVLVSATPAPARMPETRPALRA